MQKRVYILLAIFVIFFVIYASFKGCSGFVSFFDGEKKERMIKLNGKCYYSKIDKAIWLKEDETDSYKRVLNEEIDSLIWNQSIIIGYSSHSYFTINLHAESLSFKEDRISVLNLIRNNQINSFKSLEGIPALNW